ncbi:DUF4397 domain-containing protein [Clostridium cylindrosporum]|uniref:DUF4397 domain-containing protein n=1 Tax=Clostridium cylindrosporum DSM 605 TaxID=1121307 RepID=A0A0J8G6B8_CLOCY|nr:DUF4397 domain-containing protein [Clostridium cylindrosporum]KMT23151.1 hypothetical protein CLCY_6c00320 [Clostridium cylindrosporum DSM 605]
MEKRIDNLENISQNNKVPISYIRILHASPDAPSVDIVANGGLIAKNLNYKDFTSYLKVIPGNYNIKIYPSGNMSVTTLNTNVKIPPYSILTLVIGDNLSDLKLFVVPDNTRKVVENKALVRFSNLSPRSNSIDTYLKNGKQLFKGVNFGEYTNYIEIPPGVYSFQFKPEDSNSVILSVPNTHLKASNAYTIYFVGESSNNSLLQILIPMDGNSYIKF